MELSGEGIYWMNMVVNMGNKDNQKFWKICSLEVYGREFEMETYVEGLEWAYNWWDGLLFEMHKSRILEVEKQCWEELGQSQQCVLFFFQPVHFVPECMGMRIDDESHV